ncbi:MAG: LrgB family protein [Zhengella sp.]|uniref:LrgB family protein n=1 Tax=Zhengella sp. TaxID=2282762 RepID=UPI001D7CAC73|nr:LrgB family protein [Notoacmeibacter sp.]MCC0026920.1 LrgB family protein [Brucellaceae bacterium]
MNEPVSNLWVYLAASPLLWLTITLLAYVAADMLAERLNRHPLANTVLLSAALVALLLLATGTDYATYFDGAQFIHFMLGPATVALAVPLWRNFTLVRRNLGAMAAALLAGSVTAAGSAVAIAWLLGAPTPVLASLAPKSVTAPIAMELARSLGGWPALAAGLVILTGITGAIVVTPLMNLLGIRNFAARGFAAGVASHGIGTARAFQVSDTAGAFAGIAMGLNGALTSLLVLLWLFLAG